MKQLVSFALVAAALTACGSESDPVLAPSSSETAATTTSASPIGPLTYDMSKCPVDDEAFCETAVDAVEALQAADTDRLFALSREDRLVCARVNQDYFPGCETQEVLVGHGSSGANFSVEVLDDETYREHLDAILTNLDPSFSDELGDGSVRVIGVGTCGPDIPRRRTYHLAWTAAVSEQGAPAERVLGSFEFTFEDDWRIALWYLDTLDEWEAEQPETLELAFCEAGRSAWPG